MLRPQESEVFDVVAFILLALIVGVGMIGVGLVGYMFGHSIESIVIPQMVVLVAGVYWMLKEIQ